jgi:type IV secretory pathway TrbD component
MLAEWILATAMAVFTAFVHLLCLAILMRVLRFREHLFRRLRMMPQMLLFAGVLGIVVIHALEIWLYALLYVRLDAFSKLEQALYFSIVTYSTLGYGDLLMPHEWRILGATEAPVGVIMLGWSTAFLISLLSQIRLLGEDWLAPPDDVLAETRGNRG